MSKEKSIRALLLASGVGSRLKPLTDEWPKCLMPIGNRPLLEYWLENLFSLNVKKVLVNLHHHSDIVIKFLKRPRFKHWVDSIYEENLLGTAGTLRANSSYFEHCTTLLIHADNWCQCNFSDFIAYHKLHRNNETVMTMMTFQTQSPETCGIVETNDKGIVLDFHEKVKNPPGNYANGAVYLLEREVIEWIKSNPFCFWRLMLMAWIYTEKYNRSRLT